MLTFDRTLDPTLDPSVARRAPAAPRVLRPGRPTVEVVQGVPDDGRRLRGGRRVAAVAGLVLVAGVALVAGRVTAPDPATTAQATACRISVDSARQRGQVEMLKNEKVAEARDALAVGRVDDAQRAVAAYQALGADETPVARAFHDARVACAGR